MEKINRHDWFYYDETSPSCLRWKVDRMSGKFLNVKLVSAGDVAGFKGEHRGQYRWKVGLLGKEYKAHRIVLFLHGIILAKEDVVDHKDGNPSNNNVINLRVVDTKLNQRNSRRKVNNSSGVVGVRFSSSFGKPCFEARCTNLEGGTSVKTFSINKLGIMVAFRNAVIHRQKMIEELNAQGAGYTSRHGKENV